MTPVLCRVKHDPEAGSYGDCLRACIASILDMEAEAVPHFHETTQDGYEANKHITVFLRTLGYAPFNVNYPGDIPLAVLMDMMAQLNPYSYYVLMGSTEAGDHAVVCRGGSKLHDPAWVPSAMIGPTSMGHWRVLVIGKA